MKSRVLFKLLALAFAASSLIGCKVYYADNVLTATNSPQTISPDDTATVTFNMKWVWEEEKYPDSPVANELITFSATGGTCTESARTDSQGNVTCVFTATGTKGALEAVNFSGGTVTAHVKKMTMDDTANAIEYAGGEISAVAEILPLNRPSKEKVKPKLEPVQEKTSIRDGKAVIVFRLTESEVGGTKEEPLSNREVTFTTDKDKGTCTEKAVTDEKGEVKCEYDAKDPENFKGAEVKAKASVRYSEGEVQVEGTAAVNPPDRPYSSKAKPKLELVTEDPRTEDGKSIFVVRLTEQREGSTVDEPLAGREITFSTSPEKGTCTEKAVTDEKGEAKCEYTAKDGTEFTGADVTAKAVVDYADKQVSVETGVTVKPPKVEVYQLVADTDRVWMQYKAPTAGVAQLGFQLVHTIDGVPQSDVSGVKVSFGIDDYDVHVDREGTTDASGRVVCNATVDNILDFYKDAFFVAQATVAGQTLKASAWVKPASVDQEFECTNAPVMPDKDKRTVALHFKYSITINEKEVNEPQFIANQPIMFFWEGEQLKGPQEGKTDNSGVFVWSGSVSEELFLGTDVTATLMNLGLSTEAQVVPEFEGYRIMCDEPEQKAKLLFNPSTVCNKFKFYLVHVNENGEVTYNDSQSPVTLTAENGEAEFYSFNKVFYEDSITATFYVKDLAEFEGGTLTASTEIDGKTYSCTVNITKPDLRMKIDFIEGTQLNWSGKAKLAFGAYFIVNEELSEILDKKAEVEFTAENGSVSPDKATADEKGQVGTEFTFASVKDWMTRKDNGVVYAKLTKAGIPLTSNPQKYVNIDRKVESYYAFHIQEGQPAAVDINGETELTFTIEDKSWNLLGLNYVGQYTQWHIKFEAISGGSIVGPDEYEGSDTQVKVKFKLNEEGLLKGGKVRATMTSIGRSGQALQAMKPIWADNEVLPFEIELKLTPLKNEVTLSQEGKASGIQFRLTGEKDGKVFNVPNQTVSFTSQTGQGTITPKEAVTDANGLVSTDFQFDSPIKFEGGNLNALCTFIYSSGNSGGTTNWKTVRASTKLNPVEITPVLTCQNTPQAIDATGKATLIFKLQGKLGDNMEPLYNKKITFKASNGTCTPFAMTNGEGIVNCAFQANDPANFKEGSVEAEIILQRPPYKEKVAVATGILTADDGGLVDDGLKKAHKLKDNVYVVEKKGSKIEVTVDDLPEGEGMRDYIVHGAKKDHGVTKVLFLEFCKEHPVHATVGGGTIHIRPEQIGQEIDMLKEDPNGICWMNLFSLQDVNQGYGENNPSTSFSAPTTDNDMAIAKCRFTQNPDGSLTGLAYFKKKDGTEGYFKMKATRKANWSD